MVKYFVETGELFIFKFYSEKENKIFWVGLFDALKERVGRVTGTTHIFCFGLSTALSNRVEDGAQFQTDFLKFSPYFLPLFMLEMHIPYSF